MKSFLEKFKDKIVNIHVDFQKFQCLLEYYYNKCKNLKKNKEKFNLMKTSVYDVKLIRFQKYLFIFLNMYPQY